MRANKNDRWSQSAPCDFVPVITLLTNKTVLIHRDEIITTKSHLAQSATTKVSQFFGAEARTQSHRVVTPSTVLFHWKVLWAEDTSYMRHSHNKSLIRKCSWVRCHETLPSICGAAGASAADSHYYPIKAAGAELGCTCPLPTARLSAALPGSVQKRAKLYSEVPSQRLKTLTSLFTSTWSVLIKVKVCNT